ncbi:MAG: DUF3050 domain-containing protein [Thiotrichales bacterium]
MLATRRAEPTLEDLIQPTLNRMYAHPLLRPGAIASARALRLFMEHHVFAVFDFMSLAKSLQHCIAPSDWYWTPNAWTPHPAARFINEIVLGEETDIDGHGGYSSHYDLYLAAMREVGADTAPIVAFVDAMRDHGPEHALTHVKIPTAARAFVAHTFSVVATREPHRIAAAFAYGREHLVPEMFRCLLAELELQGHRAERFRFYLERHIELDEGEHGPIARQLVQALCAEGSKRHAEAVTAANAAIEARIMFWDRVFAEIRRCDAA